MLETLALITTIAAGAASVYSTVASDSAEAYDPVAASDEARQRFGIRKAKRAGGTHSDEISNTVKEKLNVTS